MFNATVSQIALAQERVIIRFSDQCRIEFVPALNHRYGVKQLRHICLFRGSRELARYTIVAERSGDLQLFSDEITQADLALYWGAVRKHLRGLLLTPALATRGVRYAHQVVRHGQSHWIALMDVHPDFTINVSSSVPHAG
jgi:hypothetical protein